MEFAKKMGLGGGMIWSIDTDDFLGVSGTKFPLLRAINEALENVSIKTTVFKILPTGLATE